MSPVWPRPSVAIMKKVLLALAVVFGLYLIGRAIAEPFLLDMTNPATYRNDWGGPSLPGVLVVHCGPGVVAAALMIRETRRVLRARRGVIQAGSQGR